MTKGLIKRQSPVKGVTRMYSSMYESVHLPLCYWVGSYPVSNTVMYYGMLYNCSFTSTAGF